RAAMPSTMMSGNGSAATPLRISLQDACSSSNHGITPARTRPSIASARPHAESPMTTPWCRGLRRNVAAVKSRAVGPTGGSAATPSTLRPSKRSQHDSIEASIEDDVTRNGNDCRDAPGAGGEPCQLEKIRVAIAQQHTLEAHEPCGRRQKQES